MRGGVTNGVLQLIPGVENMARAGTGLNQWTCVSHNLIADEEAFFRASLVPPGNEAIVYPFSRMAASMDNIGCT